MYVLDLLPFQLQEGPPFRLRIVKLSVEASYINSSTHALTERNSSRQEALNFHVFTSIESDTVK